MCKKVRQKSNLNKIDGLKCKIKGLILSLIKTHVL
jgi:hypothetical protein